MKPCTAQTGAWRHPTDYTPPRGQMILILTEFGVLTKGLWHETDAAWMPLPKLDDDLQERLRREGRLR